MIESFLNGALFPAFLLSFSPVPQPAPPAEPRVRSNTGNDSRFLGKKSRSNTYRPTGLMNWPAIAEAHPRRIIIRRVAGPDYANAFLRSPASLSAAAFSSFRRPANTKFVSRAWNRALVKINRSLINGAFKHCRGGLEVSFYRARIFIGTSSSV